MPYRLNELQLPTLWNCYDNLCLAISSTTAPALQHGLAVGAAAVQDDTVSQAVARKHLPADAPACFCFTPCSYCRLF
jgi:hypothetical protein